MSISCTLLAVALTFQTPVTKPFVSAAGGFEIKMPGTPQEQTLKVPSPVGEIEVHLFILQQGQSAFFATYNDYPDNVAQGDPNLVLEGAANGAVQNAQGKLVMKKDIKIGNIPGKEIEYTVPLGNTGQTGTGRSRIYLDKTRLYQIMVLGTADVAAAASSTAYLDSFKITGTTGKMVPQKNAAVSKQAPRNLTPALFTSEAGRFEVKFPGKPTEQVQQIGADKGLGDTHMFLVDQGNTAHLISYTEFPADKFNTVDSDKLLEETAKGVVRGQNGTLVVKKDIRLGTVPGKEVTYTMTLPGNKKATGRARIYLDKTRLYQVLVLSDTDLATSPAGTAFFNSFKIAKPK